MNDITNGHEPLTSKEGWQRFVDHAEPALDPAGGRWSKAQKAAQEETRLRYHSRLQVVAIPSVRQVSNTGRQLSILNRHQVGARRGLIVTGEAGTGKSTAITQLGKAHELARRLRHRDHASHVPVVYVTVPPAATARMLAVEFARFLGLPVLRRANLTDVTEAVCGVLCDAACELVLVDEIHNISLATRAGAEVSDQLKYFAGRYLELAKRSWL
jgi:hypothetical protein